MEQRRLGSDPQFPEPSVRWRAFERQARLAAVRDRFLRDLTAPFSLDLAARVAGLSTKHFSAWFRRRVGVRFVEWRNEERLRVAEPLVAASGLPLAQVAVVSGFGSRRTFERAFRQRFGVSARGYRRGRRDAPRSKARSPQRCVDGDA